MNIGTVAGRARPAGSHRGAGSHEHHGLFRRERLPRRRAVTAVAVTWPTNGSRSSSIRGSRDFLRSSASGSFTWSIFIATGEPCWVERGPQDIRDEVLRSRGEARLVARDRRSLVNVGPDCIIRCETWPARMSARGLYRAKTPEGGEYARIVYGIASAPGEIPRPLYEARGCEPPFDTLPTREEHEAAQARKSGEANGDEVVTISLSAEAYAVIADRAPDPSEEDGLGGYRISVRRALINRLLQLRGPDDESFSDVIERVAKR